MFPSGLKVEAAKLSITLNDGKYMLAILKRALRKAKILINHADQLERLQSLDIEALNHFLHKTHYITVEYCQNMAMRPSFVDSVFNSMAINSLDKNKETFIVFGVQYRNIDSFMPLLDFLYAKGYQIITILQTHAHENWDGIDREQCKIFSKNFPSFFIDSSVRQHEDVIFRQDLNLLLYYLSIKINTIGILVDEFTCPPLRNFYYGAPYIQDIIPKIFCFRHALPTTFIMESDMQEVYHDILTKYFVWGELHKKLFFTQSDKIVCGGWNKTDRLKNVIPGNNNSILVVGIILSTMRKQLSHAVKELLKISDARICYKPHPGEHSNSIHEIFASEEIGGGYHR